MIIGGEPEESPKPGKPKIIVIVGPTASGKTALGIALAKQFDGEIISADSRQIYRAMDIGTAKPTQLEMAGIPHYLIDIKDPGEGYTVSEYKTDALVAINDVIERGHLPLLVGGTGLYIKAVLENLDIPNVEANTALRAELEKEMQENGLDSIVKRLLTLDPDAEHIVDLKNPRRVIRAIEVATATGQPFTAQQNKGEAMFDALVIGLEIDAEELRERIDSRVDEMMNQGFVDEVKVLVEKYGRTAGVFDAIGYAEIINYLESETTLDDAVASIKMNTWHYAKRQMTWFKKDPNVHWVQAPHEAIALAEKFLQ
jgi:tRNA dimethylallyltransferase